MSANESAAPARSEQTAAAGNNKHLTTDVVRDSGKTQETLIATVDSSGGAREVVSGEEWSRWCGGHLCPGIMLVEQSSVAAVTVKTQG